MAIRASIQTLIHRMRYQLRTFRAAHGGNVIMTFALATIPMIGFVGAAVDYSRANSDQAAMQAAVDATGLMLSKDTSTISDQKASDYFNAQFHRPDVKNVLVKTNYTSSGGYQIVVTATGTVPTTFMNAFGILLNVSSLSMVDIGATSTINVAIRQNRCAPDRDQQPADPAQERGLAERRRVRLDHSLREGCRGRSEHQLYPKLDRLDRLAGGAPEREVGQLAEQLVHHRAKLQLPAQHQQPGIPMHQWTGRPRGCNSHQDSEQRQLQGLDLPQHRRRPEESAQGQRLL
jgi:Flp pilus assembly protein TadG